MLEKYNPKDVMHWFEEITKIPHGSYNEKALSDYIVEFAKERNLKYYQMDEYVVLVKKPATKGYENRKPIILQGHIDMVCEKDPEIEHDFEKDPLKLIVEDGWLRADGTTLGGDDGIAAAYMLAILDSDEIEHPAIECLFTTQEEVTMAGAKSVTGENIDGKYLFNIDGEVEEYLLVGCAGGLTMFTEYEYEEVELAQTEKAYRISVVGASGGHSGQEIEKSRANAIKILARILANLDSPMIAEISGGSKHNAIPTSAQAVVVCNEVYNVHELIENLKNGYSYTDPNMKVNIEEMEVKKAMTEKDSQDIINMLVAIPDGVQYMDPVFDGLVMTSLSNGILEQEPLKVKLTTLLRSSSKVAEEEIYERFKTIVEAFGATISDDGGYPAWEHEIDSDLEKSAIEVYKEVFNREPKVRTMHCGLECGILKTPLPETEMITFGPDMQDIHTSKERLNIESVEKIYEFIKKLLISLK